MGSLIHIYVFLFVLLRILCLANGRLTERSGDCLRYGQITNVPRIQNGDFKISSWNMSVTYRCEPGYQLYGVDTIVCIVSKWSDEPPVCIANTCRKIRPNSAVRIKEELNGAVLKFSCDALHKLEGSSKLLCLGSRWTDKPPSCQPWNPPINCDFEKPDHCGWYLDELGSQEWHWNNGSTPTTDTGPKYDHTFGPNGNGHYVYFESSTTKITLQKAMLTSPLYTPEYSVGKCFNFWYHVYGEDIGDLELFFKPDGDNITTLKPSFLVNANLGDVWHFSSVPVTAQTTDFQIVFVAKRSTGYRSDFALDDFSLGDCAGTLGPVKNVSVAVTTQLPSTQRTTTKNPSKTTRTTTFRTTTKALSTISQTTTLKTTQAPPPTTTAKAAAATTKAQVTTVKPTTQKTTQAPTSIKTSVQSILTTMKLITSTATTIAAIKTTSLEPVTNNNPKSVDLLSTTEIGEENTRIQASAKNSLKPVVNPDMPVKKSKTRTTVDSDHSSKIIYIVIGFASFISVASLVWVSIVCYRRQKSKRELLQTVSLCHSNVLYNVMTWDDSAVSFNQQ